MVRQAPSLVVRLLLAVGRRRAALSCLVRLASECREPADSLTLLRLAELAAEADASDLALRLVRQASDLSPRSPAPPRLRYRLLQKSGRERAARRLLEDVSDPVPTWVRHERANLAARDGDLDLAMREWLSSGDAFGRHQRAEVCWRRGLPVEARAEEAAALALDPEYLWSWWRCVQDEAARDPQAGLRLVGQAPASVPARLGELPAVLLERVGRGDEADDLRTGPLSDHVRPAFRERLRDLRAGACEWHAPRGSESLDDVRVLLLATGGILGPGEGDRLTADMDRFHRRECPGTRWTFRVERRARAAPYDDLEPLVRHGNRRALAALLRVQVPREDEAVVVLVGGDAPWGLCRGFGGHRMAAVQVAEGDPWRSAVVMHEAWHAVAGLRHTDGEKAEWDPFGLMGYPGVLGPLSASWVDFRQRCWMASPPGVRDLVEAGRDAEARRNWPRALREYAAAVARDPLHLFARGRLARALLRLHRPDEALEVLAGTRLQDRGVEVASFHGEVLAHLDRVPEARRAMAGALGVGRSARTHVSTGSAWGRAARYDLALGELHRAAGLAGTDPEPRFHLASVAHAQGRLARAEALYRACLRAQPRWGEVMRRLALLLSEGLRLDEAEDLLERAARLQDRSPEQAYFEGRVAWIAGDIERALARLERSRRLAPREQAPHHALGFAHVSLGDEARAARRFGSCRDLFPQSFLGRAAEAWLLHLRSRASREGTRRLLRLDPRHAPLVLLRLVQAEGAAAERWAARLRELEPRHPRLPRKE